MVGISSSQLEQIEEERFENRIIVNIDEVEVLSEDLASTLPVVGPEFNDLRGKLKPLLAKFKVKAAPGAKRNSTLEREIAFQPKEE